MNEFNLYEAVSKYYNLDIDKLSIGYGAADVLQRVIFP